MGDWIIHEWLFGSEATWVGLAGGALLLFAGLRGLIALSLLTLLLIGLSATIYHRRFRFRLEEDAVCVRKGVFRKQELRIRFARIQNVQISHPFYFKPFKLVRFALESPGAAEKEVELPGIPIDLALSMREQIMLGEAAANQEPLPEQSPEPPAQVATLYTAGAGRLFLHGLVTYQLRLVTGIVFVALSATLRSNRLEETQVWQWMADNTLLTSLGATASLLLLLLLLMQTSPVQKAEDTDHQVTGKQQRRHKQGYARVDKSAGHGSSPAN